MITVSAYVPVRNDLTYLKECLLSLFEQSVPFHEVLVIDDASSDGLAEWAAAQKEFAITYIRMDEHKGLAAARNEAVLRCTSEYIAGIDADCRLNKDWLEITTRYIAEGRLAGVGGQLIEISSTRGPDVWRKINLFQTRGTNAGLVTYLPGCNTLFRKEALTSVGGYDEHYVFHHEDTDLGRRLAAAAWKMKYIPDAIAFHARRDSITSLMRRCWGYRHARPIRSLSELGLDLVRELCKGIKHVLQDLFGGRFLLCASIDSVYFFYQMFYSCRSYITKNNNF